jgi:hypothetical protein
MISLRVTVVNHEQIELAVAPAAVWTMLVDEYAAGKGFARAGYVIDPLDDPSLTLGGYAMRLERDGLLDERLCRVTERDDAAMRLSLHADYLSAGANNMVTYATYRATPAGDGTLYSLDCHSTLDHAVADGGSREEIATSVAALRTLFDQAVAANLARLKAQLESGELG